MYKFTQIYSIYEGSARLLSALCSVLTLAWPGPGHGPRRCRRVPPVPPTTIKHGGLTHSPSQPASCTTGCATPRHATPRHAPSKESGVRDVAYNSTNKIKLTESTEARVYFRYTARRAPSGSAVQCAASSLTRTRNARNSHNDPNVFSEVL